MTLKEVYIELQIEGVQHNKYEDRYNSASGNLITADFKYGERFNIYLRRVMDAETVTVGTSLNGDNQYTMRAENIDSILEVPETGTRLTEALVFVLKNGMEICCRREG